jgi:phi LC3 family holin
MFQMDLKSRFKNKAFLIALASAVVLLLKECGFGSHIPSNWDSIVNGFITIGILLGVITDPSTPGISDQVISNTTVQAIKAAEIKEEVKTEASTTAINNTITENSDFTPTDNLNASAKIMVDTPVD